MRVILKFLYKLFINIKKAIYKFIIMPTLKLCFAECGKKVYIGPEGNMNWENIYLGNNVSIGLKALFMSTKARIVIGDNVMIGPKVTIITGDHRTDVIGEYMINIKEKLEKNDQDVIIENDVWIGANVTILKGVRVGKGSIIAAGSLVNKDVPDYTIVAGVPAVKIKKRFSNEEIREHENLLSSLNIN